MCLIMQSECGKEKEVVESVRVDTVDLSARTAQGAAEPDCDAGAESREHSARDAARVARRVVRAGDAESGILQRAHGTTSVARGADGADHAKSATLRRADSTAGRA